MHGLEFTHVRRGRCKSVKATSSSSAAAAHMRQPMKRHHCDATSGHARGSLRESPSLRRSAKGSA